MIMICLILHKLIQNLLSMDSLSFLLLVIVFRSYRFMKTKYDLIDMKIYLHICPLFTEGSLPFQEVMNYSSFLFSDYNKFVDHDLLDE